MLLPNRLITAIENGDEATIAEYKDTIIRHYGLRIWNNLYYSCNVNNIQNKYSFNDFSSKGFKNNSDKDSVGEIEPGHNQD